MTKIEIGRNINYKTLESVLIKSANEIGLKTKIKKKYTEIYSLSLVQETQEYHHTIINLNGRIFPCMKVYIFNQRTAHSFVVEKYLASEKRLKRYLKTISKNLEEQAV